MTEFKINMLRNRRKLFQDDLGEFAELLHCLDTDGVRFGMPGVFNMDYAYFGQVRMNDKWQ